MVLHLLTTSIRVKRASLVKFILEDTLSEVAESTTTLFQRVRGGLLAETRVAPTE